MGLQCTGSSKSILSSSQDVLDKGYTMQTNKGSALEAFFTRPGRDPEGPIRQLYDNKMVLKRGLLLNKLEWVEKAKKETR